jgi:hypothetical protein
MRVSGGPNWLPSFAKAPAQRPRGRSGRDSGRIQQGVLDGGEFHWIVADGLSLREVAVIAGGQLRDGEEAAGPVEGYFSRISLIRDVRH